MILGAGRESSSTGGRRGREDEKQWGDEGKGKGK